MKQLGFVVLGAIIGIGTGLLAAWIERRRSFRAEVLVLLARLHYVGAKDEDAFFKETQPSVLVACAKIRPDITWFRRREFDDACAAYCEMEMRIMQRWYERIVYGMECDSEASRKRIVKTKRDRMRDALITLSMCAEIMSREQGQN